MKKVILALGLVLFLNSYSNAQVDTASKMPPKDRPSQDTTNKRKKMPPKSTTVTDSTSMPRDPSMKPQKKTSPAGEPLQ